VPVELQRLLAKLLRKLPAQRYQTAAEVVAAIDTFLSGGGSGVSPWELIRAWARRDWR
jgi:hypothetical protein